MLDLVLHLPSFNVKTMLIAIQINVKFSFDISAHQTIQQSVGGHRSALIIGVQHPANGELLAGNDDLNCKQG